MIDAGDYNINIEVKAKKKCSIFILGSNISCPVKTLNAGATTTITASGHMPYNTFEAVVFGHFEEFTDPELPDIIIFASMYRG